MTNQQTKQNLINRLRRIEGQVRGVQNMINSERECSEIVQQLVSIRSAVHGASINFLQEHAQDCIFNIEEEDARSQGRVMTDLITLLSKVS
ncbi:MAG: metal-sensitive transcriptional regulator [Anaerolineaceae bacterium]|nr:metal-sensitive transcriptional regulator [Anaerolineaceae bacterium]